jgi:hypothetical protein
VGTVPNHGDHFFISFDVYSWRKNIVSKNRTASQPIRFIGTRQHQALWGVYTETLWCRRMGKDGAEGSGMQ